MPRPPRRPTVPTVAIRPRDAVIHVRTRRTGIVELVRASGVVVVRCDDGRLPTIAEDHGRAWRLQDPTAYYAGPGGSAA